MSNLFLDGSKLIHHLPVVEKWKRGEKIFPIHAEISPTSGCNQRCNLCYVDYLGHKSGFLEADYELAGGFIRQDGCEECAACR